MNKLLQNLRGDLVDGIAVIIPWSRHYEHSSRNRGLVSHRDQHHKNATYEKNLPTFASP